MTKNISEKIKLYLEGQIRPAIQLDGGDIEFIDYDRTSKVVKVKLSGACSGCALADITLKMGIENELKKKFPEEVEEVLSMD